MTRSRIYLTVVLVLLVSLACGMPALPVGRDAFNTAVAQTVVAGLTQNYMSPTFTLTPTLTFTPTLTPTATNTAVVTITPTFPFTPTATDTPLIPLPDLSVTVNTNCRNGPGKDFKVEGSLVVGETVKVYGIDPTGQYWYIANPDPGVDYCWLSAKFAEVDGAISLLPVLTPPSLPTATSTALPIPDFRMTYSNMDGCGNWWVEVTIYNIGLVAFKSVSLKLKDAYSGASPSSFSNGFITIDKCDNKTVTESLEPGSSVVVSAPPFNNDPAGKKITFTAILCTEKGNSGDCVTRTITFRP